MIYWLLPAYNEEDNIGPLLEKIDATMKKAAYRYRVVIVDDGSGDRTASIGEQLSGRFPVTVIRHQINRGLPQTLRTGIEDVLQRAEDDDPVIALDADNTHEPSVSLAMIDLFRKGYDVVIASRYEPGGREVGLSATRRLLSKACNTALRWLFPLAGVTDYTCGYRLYRVGALRAARDTYGERLIESTTFSCTAELLLKLGRMGFKGTEVPLVLRYDQKAGDSKMRVMRTAWDYVRLSWRMKRGG